MIKSMTAYGRAKGKAPTGQWVVEVSSVNRKLLDINVNLPKEFLVFEKDVRGVIGEIVQRGQVTTRVFLQHDGSMAPLNGAMLKRQKEHWEQLARELGYKGEIDFKFLVEQSREMVSDGAMEDEAAWWDSLRDVLKEALEPYMHMKEREGAALVHDIRHRLKVIEECIPRIELRADKAVDRYREKLGERIRDLGFEADDRVLREIAMYAEKLDVTEELTRLRSHLEQFYRLLGSTQGSVGRTLDFLVQEMQREINTMAAKSADSEVSFMAVTMKSELEKIREQIQNIE